MFQVVGFSQGAPGVDSQVVISGLDNPWAVESLDGGGFLITEKPGRILYYREGNQEAVLKVPQAINVGQGGLLDIEPSPGFPEDPRIFFTLSVGDASRGYGTALGLTSLNIRENDTSPLTFDPPILLWQMPDRFKTSRGQHFGSRIVIHQGYLYLTIGDRGEMNRAQLRQDPAGSVQRFMLSELDGGAQDVRPELYTYGHRNPQGMAVHPQRDEIWLHEHGPRGGDELNILQAGDNYGWPLVTFGRNYNGTVISRNTHATGITPPVLHWTPSIAPSGMAFYSADRYPQWQGSLFLGALAGQHLRRVMLSAGEITGQEILLENRLGRIRDVHAGRDGELYILTDGNRAALYRLRPVE